MAGVTNSGFVPKRFNEIITSLRENAKPIFQDLVKPGEEVDTSDTSTIGRLIGLIAPDMDELWQAAEQVYQAFDPNSATGVALDNIVQYMGVTRTIGSPTVLRASVWGNLGTVLSIGQVIRGVSPDRFVSTTGLTFNTTDFIGFSVRPTSVTVGDDCSFTFIVEDGIYTVSHTVASGETEIDIVEAWKTAYDALSLPIKYEAWTDGDQFYFQLKDYFSFVSLPATLNTTIINLKKRLSFSSEENGDISAPIDTVTTILTPVFGWLSVSNEVSAEVGSVEETDEQLRERFRLSKAVRGYNMAEALYAQLLAIEGVTNARVYENMTETVDSRDLPPHSFMAIVKGGTDTDIAEAVWNNKPLGISSEGNTTTTIRDSQNSERQVKFSRPTEIPIYVSVVVKKVGNTFPANGADDIRQAVVDFINTGAEFGEEIIYTRLFTPINSVPGHQVNELKIGTTSSPTGTTNIVLNWDQFPLGLPENIEVTVID